MIEALLGEGRTLDSPKFLTGERGRNVTVSSHPLCREDMLGAPLLPDTTIYVPAGVQGEYESSLGCPWSTSQRQKHKYLVKFLLL